jgi:hypothetical protein
VTNFGGRIVALSAVLLASCGGGSPVRFPTRTPPAGYPPTRAEDLAGNFAIIPTNHIALALVGHEYRIRYGVVHLPGPDQAVDALTGAYGFQTEGPFERAIHVSPGDVYVSLFPDAPRSPQEPAVRRLVACVDIRPSRLPPPTTGTLIVLDVQPIGDDPHVPLAIDAVTGQTLPGKAAELLDENNTPCDRRLLARAQWDDNLRRLSGRHYR